MARKEKKYHYIYKTTCLVTERYYIGMHSTNDLNDGYYGSGQRLWFSINKHGKENHKTEILEFLPDRNSLKNREREIVNEELLGDKMCMNLGLGGQGGWLNEEHKRKNIKAFSEGGNKKFKWLLENNEEFRNKISQKRKEKWKDPKYRERIEGVTKNAFKGKTHSQETKQKMSERHKKNGHQKGSKNSQHGTCWITNGKENKKIKKEELNNWINNGWKKGRKLKL